MSRKSIPSIVFGTVALAVAAIPALGQAPFVFADFDDGFNANNVGGSWYFWDDSEGGGDSKIVSGDTSFKPTEFGPPASLGAGQGGTPYAAKMEFTYGTKKPSCGTGCTYDPEVGLGADMRTGSDTAADLTGATHISFWVKGSVAMKCRFMAATTDITDYSFYGTDLAITTEWKEFKIDLKSTTQFSQPSWSTDKKPFNFAKVNGLEFSFSKEVNATLKGGTFFLDGVQIHGWTLPIDPVAVRSGRQGAFPRLLAVERDGGYLVSLPKGDAGKAGMVEAVGADGKVLGRFRLRPGPGHRQPAPLTRRQDAGLLPRDPLEIPPWGSPPRERNRPPELAFGAYPLELCIPRGYLLPLSAIMSDRYPDQQAGDVKHDFQDIPQFHPGRRRRRGHPSAAGFRRGFHSGRGLRAPDERE